MPKLTTGRSLRATTITWRPFFSVNRCTGGSASSVGFGGAGARMRSLRPAQYSLFGLGLAPGAFSYWTCTDDGGAAGGGGGGADAQPPPNATTSIAHRRDHVDGRLRNVISWPPVGRAGPA